MQIALWQMQETILEKMKMAKSKEGSAGRRGRQPRPRSDAIANCLRPPSVEGVREIADALVANEPVGIGKINSSLIPTNEYKQMLETYNETPEDKVPASLPAAYQPPLFEAILNLGARIARTGHAKKQHADWAGHLGKWSEGSDISDARLQHIRDLRRFVDDETNLVQISSHQYVIGNDKQSAIFSLNGSKTGNYSANLLAAKKLGFGDRFDKQIANIVGRFNNKVVVERFDDGTNPGSEIVFMPNQVVTWGYLERDGKVLSYEQIRSAVESQETGLKFVELDEPIVSDTFTGNKLVSAVTNAMSLARTKDDSDNTAMDRWEGRKRGKSETADKIIRNFEVQARVSPRSLHCFGFENAQCGIVPVTCYGEDSADVKLYRLVIGVRVGAAYSENKWQARARLAPDEVVAEKPAKATKVRVATKKVKTEKVEKVAAKKTTKKRTSKKKSQSVAESPVVTDTANETVAVEEVQNAESESDVQVSDSI